MFYNNAVAIFTKGYEAVLPVNLLAGYIQYDDQHLRIGDIFYDNKSLNKIYVVAIGKAASDMALCVQNSMGPLITNGIVITKHGHGVKGIKWPVYEAAHPIPDHTSVTAANALIEFIQQAEKGDLVIVLISGGASSLITDCPEGIDLKELQAFYKQLLLCGATINEMNIIRKHLSCIKGGQLLNYIQPAITHSLILSDVIGDDFSVIASGPTYPDLSTYKDAIKIVIKYQLQNNIAPSVLKYLYLGAEGFLKETLKPGNPLFNKVTNVLIGSNTIAMQASALHASELGYKVKLIEDPLSGEAFKTATNIISYIMGLPITLPTCFIAGGETTVTVTGTGKGGRNQHVVLSALCQLRKLESENYPVILCGGTDGTDGPTDAAGAMLDDLVNKKAIELNLDVAAYLNNNDAYHFFKQTDSLLFTGPTNTNVMDLLIILRHP